MAHWTLQVEHEPGLLLPCNGIVDEHGDKSGISLIDLAEMPGVVGENAELQAVGQEAGVWLYRLRWR